MFGFNVFLKFSTYSSKSPSLGAPFLSASALDSRLNGEMLAGVPLQRFIQHFHPPSIVYDVPLLNGEQLSSTLKARDGSGFRSVGVRESELRSTWVWRMVCAARLYSLRLRELATGWMLCCALLTETSQKYIYTSIMEKGIYSFLFYAAEASWRKGVEECSRLLTFSTLNHAPTYHLLFFSYTMYLFISTIVIGMVDTLQNLI